MVKTIDNKVLNERRNRELFEKILKKVEKELKTPPPDLTNQDVCDSFCMQYGTAIAPELRTIDLLRKKSMSHMFKVVRGGYSHNYNNQS